MAGESGNQDGVNPGDKGGDATVPKADLDKANSTIATLQNQVAELVGKVDGLTTKQAATDTKVYSRADLDSAVAEGKMTQAQADGIYEQQVENRAVNAAMNSVKVTTGAAKITAQIDDYIAALPDVAKEGTDARARVKREFDAITATQREIDPNFKPTKATELQALRAAFGPVDVLRRSGEGGSRERTEDVGGGRGGNDAPVDGDAPPRGMSAKHVAYYRDQIAKGTYRDWKDVESVEKFRNRGKRAA